MKGVPVPLQEKDLPTTSYAILGILTFESSSGYDLAKAIEGSVAYFFSPAKSQIYSELRRLVSHGYAAERSVKQQDRPDKRIYSITPKGRRALKTWLDTSPVEPDTVRSTAMVKLFFGSHMDRAALLKQMEEHKAQSLQRLREFRDIERELAGSDEMLFPYLTLRCGIAHAKAGLRWADEVIDELRRTQ